MVRVLLCSIQLLLLQPVAVDFPSAHSANLMFIVAIGSPAVVVDSLLVNFDVNSP